MNNLIKVSLLGDILCDESINLNDYKKGDCYNFDDIFVHFINILNKSNYVIANLETPIAINNKNLTNSKYSFNTPFEFAVAIKKMGVNCVSTANNHCLDRGISGLISTIDSLDKIGLKHTGTTKSAKDTNYLVQNVDGLKLGIISWTYGTNAFSNNNYLGYKNRTLVNLTQEQENWFERYRIIGHFLNRRPKSVFCRVYNKLYRAINKNNLNKQPYEINTFDWHRKLLINKCIRKVKKETDLTICYLHIGGQYNLKPSVYTRKMIEYFHKKGINVVIANHEHVVHGIKNDINNNKFATYSLGNFLGGSGTKYGPFDRNSDYSIVLHLYIDKYLKSIDHVSFSVTKSIMYNDGRYAVVPVFDYVNYLAGEEKQSLIRNALQVAYDFSGHKYNDLSGEFVL